MYISMKIKNALKGMLWVLIKGVDHSCFSKHTGFYQGTVVFSLYIVQVNKISVQDGLHQICEVWIFKALKHELFSKTLFILWGNVLFTFSWWINLWVEFPPCKKVLYIHAMSSKMLLMELTLLEEKVPSVLRIWNP